MHQSSLRLCLHTVLPSLVSLSLLPPSYKEPAPGFRVLSATVWPLLKESHLRWPLFQRRSRPEVLGGRKCGGSAVHPTITLGRASDYTIRLCSHILLTTDTVALVTSLVIFWFVNSAGIPKSRSVILWMYVCFSLLLCHLEVLKIFLFL